MGETSFHDYLPQILRKWWLVLLVILAAFVINNYPNIKDIGSDIKDTVFQPLAQDSISIEAASSNRSSDSVIVIVSEFYGLPTGLHATFDGRRLAGRIDDAMVRMKLPKNMVVKYISNNVFTRSDVETLLPESNNNTVVLYGYCDSLQDYFRLNCFAFAYTDFLHSFLPNETSVSFNNTNMKTVEKLYDAIVGFAVTNIGLNLIAANAKLDISRHNISIFNGILQSFNQNPSWGINPSREAPFLAAIAGEYLQLGRYDSSLVYCDSSLGIDSLFYGSHMTKANLLYFTKQFSTQYMALKHFRLAEKLARDWNVPNLYLYSSLLSRIQSDLAELYLEKEQWDSVFYYSQLARQTDSTWYEPYHYIGLFHLARCEFSSARDYFLQAQLLSTSCHEPTQMLAIINALDADRVSTCFALRTALAESEKITLGNIAVAIGWIRRCSPTDADSIECVIKECRIALKSRT